MRPHNNELTNDSYDQEHDDG